MSLFPVSNLCNSNTKIGVHFDGHCDINHDCRREQIDGKNLIDRRLILLEMVGSIQMRPKVLWRVYRLRQDSVLFQSRNRCHTKWLVVLCGPIGVFVVQCPCQIDDLQSAGNEIIKGNWSGLGSVIL